jgi:hypothetical protein
LHGIKAGNENAETLTSLKKVISRSIEIRAGVALFVLSIRSAQNNNSDLHFPIFTLISAKIL